MIYDIIIIWAWAAWLFAWINTPKNLNKLILEKNDKPWIKVLLSWGERANVSNMNIEPERDYFTQNKKSLLSVFKKYNQWDIMSFFASVWVNIVEEDRGRLILESGDSKELLAVLLRELKKNNCDLRVKQDVKKIIPLSLPFPSGEKGVEQNVAASLPWGETERGIFEIVVENWEKYHTKNVIVSTGWKSFFQVWTTWEWYNFAREMWINIITPYRTLCGMSTKRDLSEISWVSSDLDMSLLDKNSKNTIYREVWPMLFTHFWISWPIVHNLSNSIWEYLNKLWLEEELFEKYILDNLSLKLVFDIEKTPKRLVKFFELSEQNIEIILELQNWRSWKEAKATWGWIDMNELDKNMQSKKYPWLYFIWEVVDITGKTWGFNLQWAWSSAYVCSKSFD